MTEIERARAKEIFFKYCCNSFFLHREDDGEEYDSYNVATEEERLWRQEFIRHGKSRLTEEDFLRALACLRTTHAGEVLPEVLAAADEAADGFAKLWFANTIWELAPAVIVTPALREQAVRKAATMWRELVEKPFELSDYHRQAIAQSLAAFGVSTEEEYIRKYARNMLRHIR